MRARIAAALLLAIALGVATDAPVRAEPASDAAATDARADLIEQVRAARAAGRLSEALAAADRLVALDPRSPEARAIRADLRAALRDFPGAVEDWTVVVVEANPDDPRATDRRGDARLFAGDPAGAIDDFDRAIALRPDLAAHHWRRGIALYYAGRFADGARQFDLHETVNPRDVENAAWRFLCMARDPVIGFDRARTELLATRGDGRIPMTEIHAMFAGKADAAAVLAAAEAAPEDERPAARFYARLYVGLLAEASGDEATAKENLSRAAREDFVPIYMGEIAVLHIKLREWGS